MTQTEAASQYWDHHIEPLGVSVPHGAVPTPMEEYLFDLQGFIVLRGALSAGEVAECNRAIDKIPRSLGRGEWYGYIQREDHPESRGISYQQIYEGGAAFENLIAHPRYINYVYRFLGGQGTYDEHHGLAFIDENFVTLRERGEAIPIHSGAHHRIKRVQYGYHNGRFACGEVNVLIALTDTGSGDGATTVIPGSHKANIVHPSFLAPSTPDRWVNGGSMDDIDGAVELPMRAGDALLFVDACCHGSARRTNLGERRFSVYRYSSGWNRTRWGYQASQELLDRLPPLERELVRTQREPIRQPPCQ